MDDGLPSNAVTGIVQGRDGYLWLTTYAGLVRFDGIRFSTFTSETVPALPTDRLLGLVPMRDGSLWILTEQLPVVRFDPAAHTFERVGDGLVGTQTRTLFEDADGAIWAGTDAGLFRLRGQRFVPVGGDATRGRNVYAIARDRAGALWVGTERHGVVRLQDGHSRVFTTADGLRSPYLNTLHVGARGTVWAGTDSPEGVPETMARYDGTRFVAAPDPLSGPGRWSTSGRQILYGGRDVFTARSLVRGIARDREGSVWATTNSDGLVRLRPAPFKVYSEPEGFADRHVYSVLESRSGALWFGTIGGGVSQLQDGGVRSFRPPDIPSDVVNATYEDRTGRIWLGYADGGAGAGVCRFEAGRVGAGPCRPVPGLDLPAVSAILQDRGGAFWFATDRALCRWTEGQTGPPRCLTPAQGLPDARVRTVRETSDGALWIGTDNGLARVRRGRVRVFTTADGLSGNVVRSLYQSADGALWVGTGGRGLNRLTDLGADRPRVGVIRARDGLPDDVVYALVEDGQGRLWMSTNRGIGWARRADLDAFADGRAPRVDATLYTEADGLRNREGNGSQRAAVRARDGRLWFATQDGAAVVDPAAVATDGPALSVRVEAVAVGGETRRAGAAVHLSAAERRFEIAYTAPTFVSPGAVRFRYRLDGLDPAWVEAGTRRTAFFTNVPPGRYTFRVAARDPAGRWAEAPPLALSVAPFW